MANALPDQAQVVIIGAGIVGCSVAYHLAHKNVRDILLLEQDKWPEPGGSTSHASNFIFPIDHSEIMSKLTKYGTELYPTLSLNGHSCYKQVGGIEVARTKDRMQELRRKVASGKSWGIEAGLISPREAKELFPFLNPRRIKGAMFTPTAGLVTRSVDAAQAMVHSAVELRALTVVPNTGVTGIDVRDGRVCGVQTTAGYVRAETVVCAAGVWGPLIGRMAGVSIPLAPMHHQLVHTAPVPELKGAKEAIEYPILRDQDRSVYVRQEFDTWEIGSYQHRSIFTNPADILDPVDAQLGPTIMPFTAQDFDKPMADIVQLVPVLAQAPFRFGFNGLLSVTADGMPIIGESPEVRGFWAAEAVWVKDGPGVGKLIAEWLVDGTTSVDPHQVDISRFHQHALTERHVKARSDEGFQKIYGIVHPHEQWDRSRNIRLSPFHQQEKELGAIFFETGGWERPHWYESNRDLLDRYEVPSRSGWEAMWWSPIAGAEHMALRDGVGMIDLTGFVKFDVTGPGALGLVERLAVKKLDRPVGTVVYTPLLNADAGIKCDLTITRLDESRFRVITGGGMGTHDIAWFRRHCPTDGSVNIQDVTSGLCCIGVWGPLARALVQSVCEWDLSNNAFPFGTAKHVAVGEVPALLVRISYVGELGWEIYAPPDLGAKLWDTLWDAGREQGVVAVGIASYGSSLRLEKGYRFWGQDIHTGFNPFEAGLLRDVSLGEPTPIKRTDFIGREALLRIRGEGVARRLSCMTFDEPGVVSMGYEPILHGGRVLGYVTSAEYGYSIDRGIAYGYLPVSHADVGASVEIEYLGKRYPATVQQEPLYDSDDAKLKS